MNPISPVPRILCLLPLLLATASRADVVFESGKEGYPVYRIPAIVRASNGDLLAFCEARQGGDASEIDLVQKRSTDGGRTWGPLLVIQESDEFRSLVDRDTEITIGNPAPVVDLLDPENPGRIWMPFTLENDRVFVIHSDDHGATWSERREITAEVKLPDWGWYATGPVHSIQIQGGPHRGRLVIPCDHRLGEDGADRGSSAAHAILSDDHGRNWRLGAIDETYEDTLHANETTVVELNDGTLYFNTRDQNGKASGTRGESWSTDGGETFDSRDGDWENFRPVGGVLDPPVVQCALLRVSDELLLFSGPDESGPGGKGRSDLRIRYSTDRAETWRDGPLIHTGPAAYSGMVLMEGPSVGVLFESGDPDQKSPYQRISFVALDPRELTSHDTIGTLPVEMVLERLGAKLETGVSGEQMEDYSRTFGFTDRDDDGRHSREEYVDNGRYLTPQARSGIFRAADSDGDGFVTKEEYLLNRIITDEAKSIVQAMDQDGNGVVGKDEFLLVAKEQLGGREPAEEVFAALDTDGDGTMIVPEYLRVWGQWARTGRASPEKRIATARERSGEATKQ